MSRYTSRVDKKDLNVTQLKNYKAFEDWAAERDHLISTVRDSDKKRGFTEARSKLLGVLASIRQGIAK